jgi:hypothetical protein
MALNAKEKELAMKVIRLLADNKGALEACDEAGTNYMMYYRKFRKDSWFKSELKKAKEAKETGIGILAATNLIPFKDGDDTGDSVNMKLFIEKYARNDFKVKATLKAIGVSEDRYYGVWKKNPNFIKALEAVREEMLDEYLSLNYAIASDDKRGMAQSNSTIFAIKCLGKDKGWDERSAAPSLNLNFDKDAIDAIVRAASLNRLEDVMDAEVIE